MIDLYTCPRERALSDDEIRELWAIFDELDYPFGPMFQLMLVLGQRRGETANMRWSNLDLDAAVWHLSSDATKAGRAHDVPFPPRAMRIIDDLPQFQGPYVFSTTDGKKPVSGYSRAKQRADAAVNEARAEDGLNPLAQWSLHDLRRTCGSGMARLGVPIEHIGKVLNHAPRGVTATVYDRHTYLPEKKRALEIWAEHIEGILPGGPKGENVVDLREVHA